MRLTEMFETQRVVHRSGMHARVSSFAVSGFPAPWARVSLTYTGPFPPPANVLDVFPSISMNETTQRRCVDDLTFEGSSSTEVPDWFATEPQVEP